MLIASWPLGRELLLLGLLAKIASRLGLLAKITSRLSLLAKIAARLGLLAKITSRFGLLAKIKCSHLEACVKVIGTNYASTSACKSVIVGKQKSGRKL